MLKKIPVKRLALTLILALVLFMGAVATPNAVRLMADLQGAATPATDCSDAALTKAIYNKLRADNLFKDRLNHINVSVKNKVVTLNGDAVGKGAVAKAGKLAQVACVTKVNNKLKSAHKVGCEDGKKPCGDECIDKNQDCNLPPPPPED